MINEGVVTLHSINIFRKQNVNLIYFTLKLIGIGEEIKKSTTDIIEAHDIYLFFLSKILSKGINI